MVDLPLPEGPTNPTFSPFLIFMLKFFRTTASLEGYLNTTLSNSMSPSATWSVISFYFASSNSSFASNISKMLAPEFLALPISGMNWLFWPTPIAAKMTEKIAM